MEFNTFFNSVANFKNSNDFSAMQDAPAWAKVLYSEILELKNMINNSAKTQYSPNGKNKDFLDFVKHIRAQLKANPANNYYPEIIYNNKRIGLDINDLLYYKQTSNNLTKEEAFSVYEYLYKNRDNLSNYLKL
jgi:hypothetical protein